MIKSAKAFDKRARQLIKQILNGDIPSEFSDDDRQIIAHCISEGYLVSKFLLKAEDGKDHFELFENDCVTRKGLEFAFPPIHWGKILIIIGGLGVVVIGVIQLILR